MSFQLMLIYQGFVFELRTKKNYSKVPDLISSCNYFLITSEKQEKVMCIGNKKNKISLL